MFQPNVALDDGTVVERERESEDKRNAIYKIIVF